MKDHIQFIGHFNLVVTEIKLVKDKRTSYQNFEQTKNLNNSNNNWKTEKCFFNPWILERLETDNEKSFDI